MSYLGNQPNSVAFLTDQFSGNGSTVAFTMSVAPAATSSILVNISGVTQDPTTYAISGTTLTFSAAPPTGVGNISVRYLGIPASAVATTAYRTVTEFTATAGQTSFSVPSYTVGYIDVFRNGIRLGTADFTASTGTTVVLASGASNGDLITTESFYVSSVLNAIPAVAGAVNSTYIADTAITPAKLSQPFTAGTAVASTSGTSIDFTNIPSWVKRITVMFQGVSSNSTGAPQVQLGTSGGYVISGYLSAADFFNATPGPTLYSTGFVLSESAGATVVLHGQVIISNISGNNWVYTSTLMNSAAAGCAIGAGSISAASLGGMVDRLRIIYSATGNPADTFDAGSINILYEG